MEAGRHRQFEIHDCLGRGGFGEVYRATMVSPGGLKTKVAVKLLRTDIDPGGDALSRLRDEGRLLAALRHPSILRAYDLALLEGRIGLVTEFVDGIDLHRLSGKLGPRAAVSVIESVAEALEAAWSGFGHETDEPMRLVHRDIKPSNIRVSRHGEVKLLDFGIARSDEVDREARTGTGSTVGSLAYMAPERFARRPPGPAADVYALGVTLFEVVVGHRFHEDAVPVEMFRLAANPEAHARHVDEQLSELPEECAVLDGLLRSMLAHDPEARDTAGEVARRCEGLADELPGVSLRRWAKDFVWPTDDRIPGSFDGLTITEGTLSRHDLFTSEASSHTYIVDLDEASTEPVAAVSPHNAGRADPKMLWMPLLGVGVLLLLCGGGAWSFWPSAAVPEPSAPSLVSEADLPKPVVVPPEPTVEPVPVAPPPPVASPTPAEPVEPVVPSPVAPVQPRTSPVPVVAPVPVVPVVPEDPVAVEPPAPVSPAMGILAVVANGLDVRFRSSEGEFGAGALPVGRYAIYVNGKDSRERVQVVEGLTTHVRCSGTTFLCSSQ